MSRLFGSVREKMSSRNSTKSSKSATMNPFTNASVQQTRPAQSPAINVGEAPPAYSANPPAAHISHLSPYARAASPAPSNSSSTSRISASSITNDADQYAFLATFDTVFVIDDSGSMAGRSWREAQEVLSSISEICTKRDKDGIDVYFLNHRSRTRGGVGKADGGYYSIKNASDVQRIFREAKPTSMTPTGTRLRSILKPYTDMLEQASEIDEVKPVNMIVITDGAPSDDPESTIVQAGKKLDRLDAPPYQVGIQFFQVGNMPDARDALKELDDGLEDMGIRDMVDTATFDQPGGVLTAEGILKVVLGAVVRRLDRR